MIEQHRDDSGKFGTKGEQPRQVRSIRLTDSAWDCLGRVAEARSLTRADLLELMAEDGYLMGYLQPTASGADGEERLAKTAQQIMEDESIIRKRDRWAVKRAFDAFFQALR